MQELEYFLAHGIHRIHYHGKPLFAWVLAQGAVDHLRMLLHHPSVQCCITDIVEAYDAPLVDGRQLHALQLATQDGRIPFEAHENRFLLHQCQQGNLEAVRILLRNPRVLQALEGTVRAILNVCTDAMVTDAVCMACAKERLKCLARGAYRRGKAVRC